MEVPTTTDVGIGTDHPGGNAHVRDVADGVVRLAPETRDSTQKWFYWNVTVTARSAGQWRFDFGDREVVGPRGPAVATDDGWRWLGAADRIDATAFTYDFDADERVQFALAPAYQVADFEHWYDRYASNGRLRRETLTTAECGRSVPLVRIGSGERNLIVTCRHHSCETTASYVLEGLLSELLDSNVLGGAYTVHAVPFVDVDGVERGDQGKHRAPHDHNRDYVDGNGLSDSLSPIYRSTGAIMRYVQDLSGPVVGGLDLHCPSKWGEGNDRPFFVEDPGTVGPALSSVIDALWAAADRRPEALTLELNGAVHEFDGQAAAAPTFRSFVDDVGADLAATLEVPYIGTDRDPLTPTSGRAFGRATAVALGEWLPEA